MKQAVLMSIQTKWVRLIASGKKIVEVRKTKPNMMLPVKCYIYETKGRTWQNKNEPKMQEGRGAVVGEFICDRCGAYPMQSASVAELAELSCIEPSALRKYAGKNTTLYGWHISALKIYDKPKPLSDFNSICAKKFCADKCKHSSICDYYGRRKLERAPQSYCFVEELP